LEFEGFMRVGDLIRVDYRGHKLPVEFLDLLEQEFYGIVIAKFTRKHDRAKYITMATTCGDHKTFPCNPNTVPNITVISAQDH